MKHASPTQRLGAHHDYSNLIDRLNVQIAQHLFANVRKGPHWALSSISKYCVVTRDDGLKMREVIFDQQPTVGQLVKRIGPDAWVVSIAMKHRPRKARQMHAMAAE